MPAVSGWAAGRLSERATAPAAAACMHSGGGRASHLTMPAVTLFCRCSGLPSATTHSPTRRLAERPAHGAAGQPSPEAAPNKHTHRPGDLWPPLPPRRCHPPALTQLGGGQRRVGLHLDHSQVADGVIGDEAAAKDAAVLRGAWAQSAVWVAGLGWGGVAVAVAVAGHAPGRRKDGPRAGWRRARQVQAVVQRARPGTKAEREAPK